MAEGLCWCASDIRCPHGISQRLPPLWDDMERIVDDVLKQFDRKSIKRYLKKDLDGTAKASQGNKTRDAFKMNEDVKSLMEKAKAKDGKAFSTPDNPSKKRKSDQNDEVLFSKTMSTAALVSKGTDSSPDRPKSAGGALATTFEQGSSNQMSSPLPPARSPKTNTNKMSTNTGFTRDLMSNSLPKLPSRSASQTTPAKAAIEPAPTMSTMPNNNQTEEESAAEGIPKTDPMNPLQSESVISVGLMRIADHVARKILPWQAILCPRAVESLQDLRMSYMQAKHTTFMIQMKNKLDEKVRSFLLKKEEEVDAWIEKEVTEWQAFLQADETDLSEFLHKDFQRITHRAVQQDTAYRARELQMANELDDHERDNTRDMLNNFRRIVRASKGSHTQTAPPSKAGKGSQHDPTHTFSLSAATAPDEKPVNVEVKVLQDNIAKAQSMTNRKLKDMVRNNIRKQEEAHDWLCSLSDNAITAAVAEETLVKLYNQLDTERQKSLDSLHTAMRTYQEQHNAIQEAIVVFAGRIHQHASDFLQREQLVNRAFSKYLLAVISGEIKSHMNEQKRNAYAWETKSLLDRGMKKELALVNDFHHHINPLDKLVTEFKEKMKIQLEHITMKLQAVVNGKENDVNARKALIHKKLAKHVNKACNGRRQRLKDATAVRRDEFELEAQAVAKVDDLTGDLRGAIDNLWVKEHLRERRIFEASLGRLERLEKTALIIWNKHAYLAVDIKEDYENWLQTYKRDRDEKIENRKVLFDRDYYDWRVIFGQQFKQLSGHIRKSFTYLIPHSYDYNIEDTLEKNLEDVEEIFEIHRADIMEDFNSVRNKVEDYLALEMNNIDLFSQDMHSGLIQEWQENLVRLDGSINRRIGGLKDMEADLEETIRLSILQHEVEANVFEQLSSSRMESFWIDWQNKMNSLAKELIQQNEEYEIAKLGGKVKSRASQKDRQMDDLVMMAKDSGAVTAAGKKSSQNAEIKKVAVDVPVEEEEVGTGVQSDPIGSFQFKELLVDTRRLKIILEDIKPDIYRDFVHKLTRGLEKVRRDLGEGRQRLVPPYAATKVLLKCCHKFYEHAKLSERCVGRISSRGMLLFSEGLPMHAQATFSVSSTLALLTNVNLKDFKFDCDDIFTLAEKMKVYFMTGLLTVIHSSFQEFGEYMLKSEILWMCSVLEIQPPLDLVNGMDCKGLKEAIPKGIRHTGLFSDDPVDLMNTILDLPTDLHTVQKLAQEYELAVQFSTHESMSEDVNLQQTYNKTTQINMLQSLHDKVPASLLLAKLQPLLPVNDIRAICCLLGRPDYSIDLTVHRVCQAVSLWRKVSYSMLLLSLTAPNSEYPRLSELVTLHHVNNMGNKRVGYGNITCMSPFQSISINIDYLTSIHGAPISILQAMCIMSKSGNVDIWLEDPKQSRRHERLVSEIRELVDLFSYHIPKSMRHDEYLQVILHSNIREVLNKFDLNKSGVVPLELIRAYISKDDMELNNNQLSLVFWSLCRVNEDIEEPAPAQNQSALETNEATNITDPVGPGNTSQSVVTFQTNATHRFRIQTPFHGNTNVYIQNFFDDLNNYLHSMPNIDCNVILGFLSNVLVPTAAYELVADAMKLDPAAHNPIPSSCILYMGQRPMSREEILQHLILPLMKSKGHHPVLGVTKYPFCINTPLPASYNALPNDNQTVSSSVQFFEEDEKIDIKELIYQFILKLRVYVELDLLTKYPELLSVKASDRHYGPAGNEPMVYTEKYNKDNFYWQELLFRRLNRMNQLVLNWRNTMLDEWANSLYTSRVVRYQKRIQLIIKSISVYHTQYDNLRDIIFQQRSNLINLYNVLLLELNTNIQDVNALCLYHINFIQRCMRRYEGEYDRIFTIIKNCLLQYIQHVSSIKRRAINRVNLAFLRLKTDLEMSCNGLIMGYTSGFAQVYFNNLLTNTERWQGKLMDLQGGLIVAKEKYMYTKEHIDRDLTLSIMERITNNRIEYKDFLHELNLMSNNAINDLVNIHNVYVMYQKDGNSRLLLKIEKSIRECRKIRSAAEQEPILEKEALRDMRIILNNCQNYCVNVVNEIKANCFKQLETFDPIRNKHRGNLEFKIGNMKKKWTEMQSMLHDLIADYQKEMQKQLTNLHVTALHHIHIYLAEETKHLMNAFKSERELLILAFRKHFREYDLSEAAIFERFNTEINNIVEEMVMLFGPARPGFIINTLFELSTIIKESLESTQEDIFYNQLFQNKINDLYTLQRQEVNDVFVHSITKVYKVLCGMEKRFAEEKQDQIIYIEEMSMTRNGDMIKPQVKAVLDLLISGIEIDNDFYQGYQTVIDSTQVKAQDCMNELSNFVNKYNSIEQTVSIPYTMKLYERRVQERDEEMNTLAQASQAHCIADNSKLDVTVGNYRKDIEEWYVLTMQLLENAFHNAEQTYLSHIWPTPPSSPRLFDKFEDSQLNPETVEEDNKYLAKYKEMLENLNGQRAGVPGNAYPSIENSASMAVSLSTVHPSSILPSHDLLTDALLNSVVSRVDTSRMVPSLGSPEQSLVLASPGMMDSSVFQGSTVPGSSSNAPNSVVTYKGDMKVLMDNLTVSEAEEQEHQEKKAQKKLAKQMQKQAELEAELKKKQKRAIQLPTGKGLPSLQTTELQDGWFECLAPEGYTYFHNPETGESLWELPQSLRQPKAGVKEESSDILHTPRELIMSEAGMLYVPETVPIRVVQADYGIKVEKDPKLIMAGIAEEARAIADLSIDTAIDITRVVRGKYYYKYYSKITGGKKVNKDESIALLLGDRYNPKVLQEFLAHQDGDSDSDDLSLTKTRKQKPPTEDMNEVDKYKGMEEDDDMQMVISEQAYTEVDTELQNILKDLGMNGDAIMPAQENSVAESRVGEIVNPSDWLALGLGAEEEKAVGYGDHESSDGEDYNDNNPNANLYVKQLARYNETKEVELMHAAELDSIEYENTIENSLCNQFVDVLAGMLESQTATVEQKNFLVSVAKRIRPSNFMGIFSDYQITWDGIDQLILATMAREEARMAMVKELQTKEGVMRQQRIIEHAEDIEEMVKFLTYNNISKITSRRIAIELVLNNILTPKKLAKVWHRKEFDLKVLNLDNDDIDELVLALQALLQNNAIDMSASHYYNSFAYSNIQPYDNNYNPAYGSSYSTQQQGSVHSYPKADTFQDIPIVETDYEEDHGSQRQDANNGSAYKSFHGGWVEGVSEKNEVYYYNTHTGESSWHLPALIEQEAAQQQYNEQQYDESGPVFYEQDHTIPAPDYSAKHGDSHYGSQYDETGYHGDASQHYNQDYQQYSNQYDEQQYQNHHEQQAVVPYNYENAYDTSAQQPYDQTYEQPYEHYDSNYNYDQNYYDQQQAVVPYGQQDGYDYQQYNDQQYDNSQVDYYYDQSNKGAGGYLTDGSWKMGDAFGVDHFQPRKKPRAIPSYSTPEAQRYSKEQGLARQVNLLAAQDTWQHELVATQHHITQQKTIYLTKRTEVFNQLTQRVENTLQSFVQDIKAMQKSIKKELSEANASERDLRRVFEEDIMKPNQSISNNNSVTLGLKAEKLSFILESLEKFKLAVSAKYDSAYKQMDKFVGDWELIKAELLQIGDIYDEGIANNLQQCRMSCEHAIKVFVYDQLKQVSVVKDRELKLLRKSIHKELRSDRMEVQQTRIQQRTQQYEQWLQYETNKYHLLVQYNGTKPYSEDDMYTGQYKSITYIDEELQQLGYHKLTPDDDLLTEEELAMSFMITQLEMEEALANDYDSVSKATHTMQQDLLKSIMDFDQAENVSLHEDGSWFNKHRDALERHEEALHITVEKVRAKVQEGYSLLQSRIEALDYEVERAAEDELFQHSLDQPSLSSNK